MLYHGSVVKIDEFITPHIAISHKTPLVYATSDYNYALIRCGRYHYSDIAIREVYDGGHIELTELRDGAFQDIYSLRGYIYAVEEQYFRRCGWCMDNEWISEEPVPICYTIIIDDVWSAILDTGAVTLYRYPQFPPNVEGGLEEYLKRRIQRLEKWREYYGT